MTPGTSPEPAYDIKRVHRELYAPSAKDFSVVDVPPLAYLAVEGHGDPNTTPEYTAAVEALYSVAYTLKFHFAREAGRPSVVAPLEGLWRADDPASFTNRRAKDDWSWTMLIAQPDWVDEASVEAAVATVRAKRAKDAAKAKDSTATGEPDAAAAAALDRLRLIRLHEGRSVQILHVGSFDDEAPTLARLHDEWMPEHGVTFNGDHHEIYLSDPRRTAPEKLRTVLRQPIRDA